MHRQTGKKHMSKRWYISQQGKEGTGANDQGGANNPKGGERKQRETGTGEGRATPAYYRGTQAHTHPHQETDTTTE